MWLFQKFFDWFTGKDDKQQRKELKKTIPEEPAPRLQIRTIEDVRAAVAIKTFRDVKAFCGEIRKTLTIYKKFSGESDDIDWVWMKKTLDRLYVEVGNLADKVDRLIETKN